MLTSHNSAQHKVEESIKCRGENKSK